MLDPDSKPKTCHACAPAVACASVTGREAGLLISELRQVVRDGLQAGLRFRFKSSFQSGCRRMEWRIGGMLRPSIVHCKFLSEKGMTNRCSGS